MKAKIVNNLLKDQKILIFEVIFFEEFDLEDQLYLKTLNFEILSFLKMCPVNDLGRSDDEIM